MFYIGKGIKHGNFRKIAEIAATMWYNMGNSKSSNSELLSQLRNYKTNNIPFDTPYNIDCDTPLTWWCTCEDNYNHLQELAIKLFSVVPHSAGCERNFSNLGWLYSTRRHNLNLEKVEDMSKTYSYYLAQTKKEIQY